MTPATLAPPAAPTRVACRAGDGPGGYCHIIDGMDRPICGGRIAPDSPGRHLAPADADPCTCGRPRCPDCELEART